MNHDTSAAPPDAAGHQGSTTRPEQVEQSKPEGVKQPPQLAQDGRSEARGGRGAGSLFLVALLLLAVGGFFFFVYGPQ